jgi:hypothetical protein
MEFKITTEYRHAQAGELFVENGELRVSEGQWESICGRMKDQMGEVVIAIEPVVQKAKAAPRKRASRAKELVNA